jgi:hypothetical protein
MLDGMDHHMSLQGKFLHLQMPESNCTQLCRPTVNWKTVLSVPFQSITLEVSLNVKADQL